MTADPVIVDRAGDGGLLLDSVLITVTAPFPVDIPMESKNFH